MTDADGYSSTLIYNFDFGAVTSKQTFQPNTIANLPGPVQTFTYDAAGRIEKVIATTNSSYTSYVYGPNYLLTLSTVNNVADEASSTTVFDGMGRTVVTARNHPDSDGGYSARHTIYDRMGRAVKQSNPTETNAAWAPAGDDAAGWVYTEQTYDWKGRPRITTNPSITGNPSDVTTKEASYSGCGCAGGEVVTLTDEGTLDGGVPKRRQQKIYSDILGRTVKTELLNWQGGTPYSTTINVYNARDQVKSVRQYQGDESSGVYQETTMIYDGYARLKTKHAPEQQVDANNSASTDHTTWDYFNDDTIQKITDARGASATYGYNNNRRLVTSITYGSGGSSIPVPATVTFGAYDAAGNRTSMSDGSGSVSYQYNQLSQLTSETRQFSYPGPAGSYTLSYEYNLAGELKKITDPTNAAIDYSYDALGRTIGVTGSSFGGVTQYATNMKYRAWGDVKEMSYGNSHTVSASYNARLQPTHFEIPGVMAKDYQYQADGRIRYSADLMDNRFDRSYSYDHAGRIKEAFSGPLARGQADTNDRPYKEYHQYDAMDHLVGRVGSRHWSQALPNAGVTDSFVNNRNPNWEYDADGRLTNGDDIQSTFDAAGRAVTVVSNAGNRTQTLGFDGDGRQSRMVDAVTEDDGFGNMITTTTTRYSVSSTVLGKVITELDETGQKTRSFVYSGDKVLAWQQKSGSFEGVSWEYRDVSDASYRMGTANGAIDEARAAEKDPLGSNAGVLNPYSTQGHQHWPGEDSTYPGFADFIDTACTLDGTPVPCSMAMRFLARGIGRQYIPGETDERGYPLPRRPTGRPKIIPQSSIGNPSGAPRGSDFPHTDLFDNEGTFIGNVSQLLPYFDSDPQNPRPDLPDYIRNVYKTRQGTIDRCINRVFGQKADGTPDIAATVMERQTIANAPQLDYTLMTQSALQAYTSTPDTLGMPSLYGSLGHGTVYIASDLYPKISQEEGSRAFFHELGNILSGTLSKDAKGFPDYYAFGDPKGIGNQYKDKDTGARLEKCIFKTVLY